MRIRFGSPEITLGGGPKYYLGNELELTPPTDFGLEPIPGTNDSKQIFHRLGPRLFGVFGQITATDEADIRAIRRDLGKYLGTKQNFLVEDDYVDAAGVITIDDTYEFVAYVEDIKYSDYRSTSTRYLFELGFPDPLFYSSPAAISTQQLNNVGFGFPFGFPFGFEGSDASFTVTNEGNADVFPIFAITGPGTNFRITSVNSLLSNNVFIYNDTLISTDNVIITPQESDTIKIRKNGVGVANLTNNNFDALLVPRGETYTFDFAVESNEGPGTQAQVSFRSGYSII
jgi:hypothetical protein